MYCVKNQKSSIKALLVSIVLILSCVFLYTSCPTGGSAEMYRLELSSGVSESGVTTAIYYSPVDKAWFEDIDGRNQITKVPHVPSGEYKVTLLWNNSDIAAKVGSEYYRQVPITRDFLGYSVNSRRWIDSEGNISSDFSISRSTRANADYDQAKSYTFPTAVEVNKYIQDNSQIRGLGYEFLGWSQMKDWSSSVSDRGSIQITGDTTYYATYKFNGVYTLTIDWNGETSADATKTVYYKPNKGWYRDSSLEDALNNITLPKKEWIIDFDKNIEGESNPSSQTITWSLKNLGGEEGDYLRDLRTGVWNTQKEISSNITISAEWETNQSIIFPEVVSSGHKFEKWVLSTDTEVEVTDKKLDPIAVEEYVRNGKLSYTALWDNQNFAYIMLDSAGATTEQPGMLYYSLSDKVEKKWHQSVKDDGIESIDPPKKVWTIDFETGYSDVENPQSLTSEWTFDGYYYRDDTTSTKWIDKDGVLSTTVKVVSGRINLVASWVDQTLIEELPQVSKSGMVFKGWSLTKNGSGAILSFNDYTPKSEKTTLYAQWENIVYSIDFTEDSYGIYAKPISGTKNILLDTDANIISLKLSSSNEEEVPQFNVDNIDTDVSGWFPSSAFRNALLNAKYVVKGYSEDNSVIYISVEGALSESPNGVIGANKNDSSNMGVRIPLTAIKDSYNAGTISPSRPIYYEVVNEVKITLVDGLNGSDTNAERYYGTLDYPIVGNPGVLLGKDGNGVLIRVKAENAKFKEALKPEDVKKWLKPINVWFANENITDVLIDSSSSYSETDKASYITLRLNGKPSAEIVNRKQTTLAIPYNDLVGGSASPETVEHDPYIYYRSEKVPQIVVDDSSSSYKGSAMYPFTATPYVKIGESGEGYTIRIRLDGRTFTNDKLVVDSNSENEVVRGWFTSSSITSGDAFGTVLGDNVEYKVLSGGNGAKYVDVRISGFTTHSSKQQSNAYFSIPNNDIGLKEDGAQEITINYVITDPVEVVVDTAPPYRGGESSSDKRLRIPYYVGMGNEGGEKIRFNVNNGYFSSLLTQGQNIKSWISAPDDYDMSNLSFIVSEIGSDRSYIIVNVTGFSSSDAISGELNFNVPNEAIDYAEEHLVIPQGVLYYFSGIRITAYLTNTEGTYYYGGSNKPLNAVPYTKLGSNGEGVQIEVNLSESEGYNFVFADRLTNDEIKKWFTIEGAGAPSFNAIVEGDNLEYSYVSGAGTKSVIVNIKGYITKDNVTYMQNALKIRIPYTSIKGASSSLPNIEAEFCITSTSQISVVFSDDVVPGTKQTVSGTTYEERYRGSSAQRLSGNDAMWLNSTLMGNDEAYGFPIRVELNNAVWANDLTNDDIKGWFDFKSVSPEGSSITPQPIIQEYSVEMMEWKDNTATDERASGKRGSNYVTFLLKGYFSPYASELNQSEGTSINDAYNVLSINPKYLQNVSENLPEDYFKAVAYTGVSQTIINVEAITQNGYVGNNAMPITGAENVYLFREGQDGQTQYGVRVGLRVSEGSGTGIKFALPTSSMVKKWMEGLTQLETSSIEISDIEYIDVLDASIAKGDHKAIGFTLKGYFKKGASLNPPKWEDAYDKITLTYEAFANSTPSLASVEANIYTESRGPVKLTLGTDNGYFGTSANPIVGTPYVSYGVDSNDVNVVNGVKVELKLENATFSTNLNSDVLSTLFREFTNGVSGELTYALEQGTGPGYNRAVVVIKGFPRGEDLDNNFVFNLPSSCIYSSSSDIEIEPVHIYYKTNSLEEISVSTEEGFFGSSTHQLTMTPYVNLGENSDGVKVRLSLKQNKFSASLTPERIKTWFKNFETAVNGDFEYEIQGQGSQNLDITIKGYGANSNATSTVYITIPYDDIEGTTTAFGDKQVTLHYVISTPVAVSINDGIYEVSGEQKQYYGTNVSPVRSVKNVVYGNGEGVRMRMTLQNAKFSDDVITISDTYDIASWFVDAPATRKFKIVNVNNSSSIDIEVSGYDDNGVNGKTYQYKVSLPYNAIKNADQSIVSDNRTISTNLYFNSLGEGNAEISASALYSGGSKTNPITGRKYMLLTRGSNETLGARVRIELSNLLFANLPEDNNLTDIGWFNDFKSKYGSSFTFTRVDGGNDESYVVVEVNGYPTVSARIEGNATISIPKDNIKGASDDFEAKSFSIFYKTEDDVTVALSSDGAFVGGSKEKPLGNNLVKYVEFNNGNGVEARIELKNARFSENVKNGNAISGELASLLVQNLPSVFKGDNGEEHPSVEYVKGGYVRDENNRDNYYSFIRFRLKGYVDSDALALGTCKINIPYKFLKNGGPTDDDTKLIEAEWYYETTTVKTVSATVTTGAYYGSSSTPIVGRSNVLLGGGENGVNVRVQLNDALFSDVIEGVIDNDVTGSNNVKLWFRELNEKWGGDLTYTLVKQSGSGKGTNYAIVNIKGAPIFNEIGDNKEIKLYIPGNHIQKAYFPSTGDTEYVTLPFYYSNKEKVEIEIDASSNYVGGSESNPFKATPFITLSSNTYVRIALKDPEMLFREGITNDDVTGWFASSPSALGGDLKFTVVERQGSNNYVIVKIDGYVASSQASGSFNVSIPYSDVVGAQEAAGTFEAPMYYDTTDTVTATVSYVGTTQNYIQGYQNIYLNNKNGVVVRITLTNAKWIGNLAQNSDKINAIFTQMSNSGFKLAGATYSLNNISNDRSYIEVTIKGYPTDASTIEQRSVTLNVSYDCIDSASSALGSVETTLNVKSQVDNINIDTSESGYYGTNLSGVDKRIKGTAYIKLKPSDAGVEVYKVRFTSSQARFKQDITSDDIRSWMSRVDEYGKATSSDTSSLVYSVAGRATDGTWIDVAITGNFKKPISSDNMPINVSTSALLNYANESVNSIPVYLALQILQSPTFEIETNTLKYAQYERLDNEGTSVPTDTEKRFKVTVSGATFVQDASTDIKSNQIVSDNIKFKIKVDSSTTAYIYATGRFDTLFNNVSIVFTIPQSVVTNAADNFAIKTIGDAKIDSSGKTAYFAINENVLVSYSEIEAAISRLNLNSHIYTSASEFVSHGATAQHVNQTLNFYKVQEATVPYTTGNLSPIESAKLAHDYEISDLEVSSGVYLAVLRWATTDATNKYTFFDKSTGATADAELFGFTYADGGTLINRASSIDPASGYLTSYRNAVLFCNAFTEWWNYKKGLTGSSALKPVYVTSSGNVIRNYSEIGYPTDSVISSSNNGFRLPSIAEWQYAASVSRDPLTSGFAQYNGTASLPDLVYAQSYATPSGFPSRSSDTSVSLTNYIIFSTNYGPGSQGDKGSQGVGTYVTSVPRKANLLGLYDMSGNVAEWTSTDAGNSTRYVVGGHAGSADSDVAVGSFQKQSVNDITAISGYNTPVGIRLVRSLI